MDLRNKILELLQQQKQLHNKSQNKIAKELKISASTLSQVIADIYPNSEHIYLKIKEKYEGVVEIVGVDTKRSAKEIFDEIMEDINGT
jgi:DNA-binding Lrp family transcriptional regulator